MITIEPPSSSSISRPGLTRFLKRARSAVGLPGEVDVLLTSDAELQRLNRTYRGKNKATDVLSFPTPFEISPQHAGDLAISLDTAARQAAAFNHSLEVEIKVLLLHGLLHLSGQDHETDDGAMATREAELRATLKLPTSLIHRTLSTAKTTSRPLKKMSQKPSSRPKTACTIDRGGRP
jgi:probable rRNA maturation factor